MTKYQLTREIAYGWAKVNNAAEQSNRKTAKFMKKYMSKRATFESCQTSAADLMVELMNLQAQTSELLGLLDDSAGTLPRKEGK